MSVERITRGARVTFRVRWREGGRNRSRTFDTRRDAKQWDAEVRRRQQLGTLHLLDAGRESLDGYVAGTWAPTYAGQLAVKTRRHYVSLYDHHLSPFLGSLPLRSINAETVARWQADRLAQGTGPVAVRHALELLGSIMQRAFEAERVPTNPVRQVRKAPRPRREEVRPVAPAQVEAMRAFLLVGGSENPHRDACLVSVLAYAGLRPGEALGLRWGDLGEKTILVQRSVSVGEEVIRRHARIAACDSSLHCAPIFPPGASLPGARPTPRLSSPPPTADRGARPPTSPGAGVRSVARSRRRESTVRAPTTSGTRSRRSCFTRDGT